MRDLFPLKTDGRRKSMAKPVPKDILKDARAANMKPLEYMLAVMNDPAADAIRRDRMAIASAPFCHPRFYDQRIGKKEREAEASLVAGVGTQWGDDLEFETKAN